MKCDISFVGKMNDCIFKAKLREVILKRAVGHLKNDLSATQNHAGDHWGIDMVFDYLAALAAQKSIQS